MDKEKRVQTLKLIIDGLKTDYKTLSEFELLSIATQLQRNQILEAGLNVSKKDEYPSALEAISIALGYKSNENGSMQNALYSIAVNLELQK